MLLKGILGLFSQDVREHPLMISDFKGDGRSEITPKNRTLGGMWVKNRQTSFMDDPYGILHCEQDFWSQCEPV